MKDRKRVYLRSLAEARLLNEKDDWIESYKENCICARAIEFALRDGYKDNRLTETCAKDVIREHGYPYHIGRNGSRANDRLAFVLRTVERLLCLHGDA